LPRAPTGTAPIDSFRVWPPIDALRERNPSRAPDAAAGVASAKYPPAPQHARVYDAPNRCAARVSDRQPSRHESASRAQDTGVAQPATRRTVARAPQEMLFATHADVTSRGKSIRSDRNTQRWNRSFGNRVRSPAADGQVI
jgi:hypothetical protein